MTETGIKAFGYLRVSGKSQVEGLGFDRQIEKINGYAAITGIKIVQWFREEGVSGSLADRPALQEMMVALMSDGVHTVLIEKLDRLARDMMVQENLLWDMKKQGITLISVAEPDFCSEDPTRILMRQIMGAIAQYDKTMIVLKLRAARQRARIKSGIREGAKPYGILDGEREIAQRMIELKKRLNYRQVASKLNDEGIATRSGKRWFPATVRKILVRR
jgi:DNA invertase Pin-like site-specific DNA recombinase